MKSIVSMLLILFAGFAHAGDPPGLSVSRTVPMTAAVAGAVKCDPGRFVPVELASGKPALVEASDPDAVRIFEVKAGGTLIGVRYDEPAGAEAKEYSFPDAKGKVYVALARKASVVTVRALVNGAEATDTTPEGPPLVAGSVAIEIGGVLPPVPGPIVVPGGKAAAFVIVEETADATANRAAFFSDPGLAKAIKDQGLKYQTFDQNAADQPQFPAGLRGYADRAKGKKLPRVFVTDAAGKLLYEGDLPASAGDLVTLLSKFKG